MAAAMRSMPEWAASESMPSEPVRRPVRSLSSVMAKAASTEKSAAERLALCVVAACSGLAVWSMVEWYMVGGVWCHSLPPPVKSPKVFE